MKDGVTKYPEDFLRVSNCAVSVHLGYFILLLKYQYH